jgi:hypothetical protein
MTNAITVPDFTDSQYDDLTVTKPRLTALRGNNDTNFGFFATLQDVGTCDWVNFDPTGVVTYEYQSGGKEEGLLFQNPIMLVLPTSPLLAIDKAKTKEQKRMICCEYDRAKHSERLVWDTGRSFDVILLGKDLKPLHTLPFEMILKGAAQATFHSAWLSSCQQIARMYCQSAKKIYKPKDDRFNKLCVFRPIVTRRLVGGEQKSYSLVVDSFVQPESIDDSFLGTVKHYEIANQLLVIDRSTPLALMPAIESVEGEAGDGVADAQLIPEPPEQTAELEGLKRSLVEKFDMLGWKTSKRKDWAFARHDCNSGNWTLQQWQEANDDLQELIDAHALPVLEASAS